MNNSYKVLIVGPNFKNHRGGIGAVLEVYSKYINNLKFIPTYKNTNFFINLLYFIKSLWLILVKLLADRNIEIVHIHSASRGSFYRKSIILLIVKLFGKKIIFHVHGAEFQVFYSNSKFKFLIRYLLSLCDLLICLSGKWKNFFQLHFNSPVLILNNVVDFIPDNYLYGISLPFGKVMLLFL